MKDFHELAEYLLERAKSYTPDEAHTSALHSLAQYIKNKIAERKPVRLNFICTHNSRRSHFGQVLTQALASHLNLPDVQAFSGGTEATAFHPNAVTALQELGLKIEKMDNTQNPHYRVTTGTTITEAFSKVYSDAPNPDKDFAAIMVCSSADAGCPVVIGAEQRISLPFEDPKVSDGTPQQAATYRERALQIGTEIAWAFMRVTSN
jgi:arsenate reductase